MSADVTQRAPTANTTDAVATAGEPSTEASATPRARSAIKAVSLPTEHGGWGLTFEAVLLGLIVQFSAAGVCLGVAAFLAFLARTPLKVVLVDRRRQRTLPRTRLAQRVLIVEIIALASLAGAAVVFGAAAFWTPLIVIAPLAALELWFDMRSRSRRLLPELAGAVGIEGIVAVLVLAGGGSAELAVACWLILSARSITAITTVRDIVNGIHGRTRTPWLVATADVAAVALALSAAALYRPATVGTVAVVAAIVIQRLLNLGPTPRAVILGVRQTIVGLAVVAATAIGMLVS